MAEEGWQLTAGGASVAVWCDTPEQCAQFMLAAGFPQFSQLWVIDEAKPIWMPGPGMYYWIDPGPQPRRYSN